MVRDFCTYFDHRYLPYGLALLASLRRHAGAFRLHVLCLDAECARILRAMALPEVRVVELAALEAADPALAATRSTRGLVEYYFTCTAAFMQHLLAAEPSIDVLAYVDSDLWFTAPVQLLFDDMGDASVHVVEHRPPPRLSRLLQYGRFNVGWVAFRRDDDGMACLRWWRERCLEWCFDRVEDGKFGDQGYLTRWPELFRGVRVCGLDGACVAPWNVERYALARGPDGGPTVDGKPLVFFHFHGLKRAGRRVFETGLGSVDLRMTAPMLRLLYAPYVREFLDGAERARAFGLPAWTPPLPRAGQAPVTGWGSASRLARGVVGGRTLVAAGPGAWCVPWGVPRRA